MPDAARRHKVDPAFGKLDTPNPSSVMWMSSEQSMGLIAVVAIVIAVLGVLWLSGAYN